LTIVKDKILLAVKGFCMGSADVVPGVSGGTMAFILGIYADLIAAIKSFDSTWLLAVLRLDFKTAISRPHFAFLIPLGCGLFCALMFFTRVIHLPVLLIEYPEQIYGLFFGLIAGSIVVLLMGMSELKLREGLMILLGLLLGFLVFNLVPTQTPDAAWFIFLAGALSICAMILPGISGSFILLMLNKYAYIFNAIGYFKFSILIPFGLGAITGLLVFSRVLSYLLSRYYRQTILFISGLLIASLYVIWPFQERVYETVREKQRLMSSTPVWPHDFSEAVFVSFALLVCGLLFVLMISKVSAKK